MGLEAGWHDDIKTGRHGQSNGQLCWSATKLAWTSLSMGGKARTGGERITTAVGITSRAYDRFLKGFSPGYSRTISFTYNFLTKAMSTAVTYPTIQWNI